MEIVASKFPNHQKIPVNPLNAFTLNNFMNDNMVSFRQYCPKIKLNDSEILINKKNAWQFIKNC